MDVFFVFGFFVFYCFVLNSILFLSCCVFFTGIVGFFWSLVDGFF